MLHVEAGSRVDLGRQFCEVEQPGTGGETYQPRIRFSQVSSEPAHAADLSIS